MLELRRQSVEVQPRPVVQSIGPHDQRFSIFSLSFGVRVGRQFRRRLRRGGIYWIGSVGLEENCQLGKVISRCPCISGRTGVNEFRDCPTIVDAVCYTELSDDVGALAWELLVGTQRKSVSEARILVAQHTLVSNRNGVPESDDTGTVRIDTG